MSTPQIPRDVPPAKRDFTMRILIADDHDLVRETIAAFLTAEGTFDATTASDLNEAITALKTDDAWDLILLDYAMPGMEGLKGLEHMLAEAQNTPVALMSGTASKTVAEEALALGAIGFLPKTLGAKSLVNAVRFMAAGERFVPVSFLQAYEATDNPKDAAQLSPRERQVLEGLMRGLSNKEIAREVDLQEVTVKLHVKTLCRKLGAKNRTQAALAARDAGLA